MGTRGSGMFLEVWGTWVFHRWTVLCACQPVQEIKTLQPKEITFQSICCEQIPCTSGPKIAVHFSERQVLDVEKSFGMHTLWLYLILTLQREFFGTNISTFLRKNTWEVTYFFFRKERLDEDVLFHTWHCSAPNRIINSAAMKTAARLPQAMKITKRPQNGWNPALKQIKNDQNIKNNIKIYTLLGTNISFPKPL